MKTNALFNSLLFHTLFGAAVSFLLFFNPSKTIENELLVDIIEIKSAALGEGNPKPPNPKQASTTKNVTSNAISDQSTDNNQTQTNTSTSATGSGNSISEEYEVSEMPILVNEIKMPYPKIAKAKGIQGRVLMNLIIDDKGVVRSAVLVSGPDEELNRAAINAIKNFKFRPAKKNGKSVAIKIRYAYRFILE
jgi:periplasmic protein TonB